MVIMKIINCPHFSLENDRSSEAQEAIRNLVLMIATLSMCGYVELRPNAASMGCIFQILGFCMPQPSGRGKSKLRPLDGRKKKIQ